MSIEVKPDHAEKSETNQAPVASEATSSSAGPETTKTTTNATTNEGDTDYPANIHVSKHARKSNEITLRALLSSKEAGVVIGRGGQSIAQVRNETGVKAGVSKSVPGVQDRVLSVGGPVDAVAQAYASIAQLMTSNAETTPTSPVVRLLISHLLIGSVIGKGGDKIRSIQQTSGARMVASKEMLPQSTERVVEVSGQPESIKVAVLEVAKCLLHDWDRSQGTVLYHPGSETIGNGYPSTFASTTAGGVLGGNSRRVNSSGNYSTSRKSSANHHFVREGSAGPSSSSPTTVAANAPDSPAPAPAANVDGDANVREQKISIPSDMVGCIIGRGGSKINEIRRASGSRISIAKTAHDETGERMFVISGLPENNERALYLLYNQLENEKERRVQSVAQDEKAAAAPTTVATPAAAPSSPPKVKVPSASAGSKQTSANGAPSHTDDASS